MSLLKIKDLDSRCNAILTLLYNSSEYIQIDYIAVYINMSGRSVYTHLKYINSWLKANGIPPLCLKRGHGIMLSGAQKSFLEQFSRQEDFVSYFFSSQERLSVIICVLLYPRKQIYIEQLEEYLQVSRNTIFSDLKKVKTELGIYKCSLSYTSAEGYQILGNELKKRTLFIYYYQKILTLLESNKIDLKKDYPFLPGRDSDLAKIKLKAVADKTQIPLPENMLKTLSVQMCLTASAPAPLQFDFKTGLNVKDTSVYRLFKTGFPDMNEEEILYYCFHFISYHHELVDMTYDHDDLMLINKTAKEMVDCFLALSAVKIEEREQLISRLASHLKVSLYRYQIGIDIGNPLIEEIRKQYGDIYEITEQVCDILKQNAHVPVNENEIGYITLYFACYTRKNRFVDNRINLIVVCPSGLATASMLKTELENLSSRICVTGILSAQDLQFCARDYDYIISTVDLPGDMPYIRVSPIITEQDKKNIKNIILKKQDESSRLSVTRIMDIITPYISPNNYANVEKELNAIINRNRGGDSGCGPEIAQLLDFFSPGSIRIAPCVSGWEEAIRAASAPLVEQGYILETYVDAMISLVSKYGPYIVVNDHIALAHAHPENGVLQIGLSLLILKKPVDIIDKKVDLIFVIAPVDNQKHLFIINLLMKLISNPGACASLLQAEDPALVFETIRNLTEK